MCVFEYGTVEIEHLKKHDKKLGKAIEKIGMIKREIRPDVFTALIRNIVEQQISTKAADTVWGKLCNNIIDITPKKIANTDIADIQKCGISFRKAGYIKGIAEAVNNKELDILKFDQMPDEEIIKKLSALHGVGVWTAEMLLIFSLCRKDVVSWGDLALRRGMMNLYGLKEITKEQFLKYKKRYSPYGSIASLYLWEISAT